MKALLLVMATLASGILKSQVSGSHTSLVNAVQTFSTRSELIGASWGVQVVPVDGGPEAVSAFAGQRLIPASALKLITTGAALMQIGPQYRFETSLAWYTGKMVGDTLVGDLVLQAGGDPSLAFGKPGGNPDENAVLSAIVEGMKKSGIRHVKGRLLVVDHFFNDPMPPGAWTLEDMGNYYASPIAGMAWNANRYTLTFRTGKPGTIAELLSSDPEVPVLTHIVQVTAGQPGSGDQAYIYGAPGLMHRYVMGTLPPNRSSFTIRGSVPDPASFAGHQIVSALATNGIHVLDGVEVVRGEMSHPAGKSLPNLIWQHQSPSLLEMVRYIHLHSDNLFAEMLLKTLGKQSTQQASTSGGLDAVAQLLGKFGVPASGYTLKDGSGLSRSNLITPETMTTFLKDMKQTPVFDDWIGTMAKAGMEGTMRLVQLGDGFKGTLYGKSGYMEGIRSYAGYYRSESGKWYAYCIIVNHATASPAAVRGAITGVLEAIGTLP